MVKGFRERPLKGPYRYVWLDALEVKRPEEGRIVNVACRRRGREQRRAA